MKWLALFVTPGVVREAARITGAVAASLVAATAVGPQCAAAVQDIVAAVVPRLFGL